MTRMAATRDGYGQALLELAENDKVVVLEADLGKSTKSLHFVSFFLFAFLGVMLYLVRRRIQFQWG